MPSPFIAFPQVNGALRSALKIILKEALADEQGDGAKTDDQEVIGLVIPTEHAGKDWAEQAAAILKWHPNCPGLVVAWDKDTKGNLCPNLRASLQTPFELAVKTASKRGNLLLNLLRETETLRSTRPTAAAMRRAADIVHAADLYQHLEYFGHGGKDDITNHVLAPLRLLFLANRLPLTLPLEWTKEAERLLKKFKEEVIGKCDTSTSCSLSAELKEVFDALPEKPWENPNTEPQIERIMDLLTECRGLAGARPGQSDYWPKEIAKPLPGEPNSKDQKWSYRVLVIDDHAAAWRPVFERLQRAMAQGEHGAKHPVTFEFPTAKPSMAELLAKLPDYDAVLLDVYLPGLSGVKSGSGEPDEKNKTGIDLLKEVRRHYVNLPIVVWTSSRAPELPAEARLAHGFLFKKNTTIQEMAGLLEARFREGNAKRRYPLPGHFFDHSILERANRKSALRLAEYCTKHLDSFHAMDESYFRFFTDHGGRHLLKLVELLGETLRPLVADDTVFSSKANEREEEILSLYLAVFLHEFGMLRLKGPCEPDWERLIRLAPKSACWKTKLARELALVRALHAVRGMVLLAREPKKDDPHHWPDEEGRHQAEKRLWKGRDHYLRSAVALITGHHSRLLPLDKEGGCWNHKFQAEYLKKAKKALGVTAERADRLLNIRFYGSASVEATLQSLLAKIADSRLERLRKQCAIFRFVDAIDMDHTRNPARFLCRAGIISSLDCRETLKRQVVRHVRIEGGRINMETNVNPPPPRIVSEIVETIARKEGKLFSLPEDLCEWIRSPWRNSETKTDGKGWRVECHELIDTWLATFWAKPRSVHAGFIKTSSGQFSREEKMHIASLTALSAAWEVLSEYRAIIDCDLTSKIILGDFWRNKPDPEGWAISQENMLSILFDPDDGLDKLTR